MLRVPCDEHSLRPHGLKKPNIACWMQGSRLDYAVKAIFSSSLSELETAKHAFLLCAGTASSSQPGRQVLLSRGKCFWPTHLDEIVTHHVGACCRVFREAFGWLAHIELSLLVRVLSASTGISQSRDLGGGTKLERGGWCLKRWCRRRRARLACSAKYQSSTSAREYGTSYVVSDARAVMAHRIEVVFRTQGLRRFMLLGILESPSPFPNSVSS